MDSQDSPKKKSIFKRWWFWVLVVIALFILIGASGSKSHTSIPAPADTDSSASTGQQTLLDISGSGTKTTQKFTAGGDWDLNWSYDCSGFAGGQGNLQIFVYKSDGTISFQNTGVNQLGASGADVEHYHNGGTFYLMVNSVCKWKAQVKG